MKLELSCDEVSILPLGKLNSMQVIMHNVDIQEIASQLSEDDMAKLLHEWDIPIPDEWIK
jgi:hypothetical protein